MSNVDCKILGGPAVDVEISGLSVNSASVRPGDLFIAIKGQNSDGHDFVNEAMKKKASGFVLEKDIKALPLKIIVKNSKTALAQLANNFYDNPSKNVKLIGITGTNGKTTVSYLLEKVLNNNHIRCGVIGTISYRLKKKVIKASNTTPGNLELFALINEMRRDGLEYAAIEISSHALHQERVKGLNFKTAIFTNITQDHLDYHKTFGNYLKSKLRLFENLTADETAVINADALYSKSFINATKANIILYGIKNPSLISASDINLTSGSSRFILNCPRGAIEINTYLIGIHNIYNILAASAALFNEGFKLQDIKKGIESLVMVEGRLERVNAGQNFGIFIDFAHTPDALFNVLSSLRPITKGKVIVVFGCGGDRDRTKRSKMGKVASELADYLIITNDNPRSEDPESISGDILKGIKKGFKPLEVILDRKRAIERAVSIASESDSVVIAGKGHEDYQIFKGKRVKFSDKECALEVLNKKLGAAKKVEI